ncbi:MAG: lysophospholipid acyltransferase family protein [Chloroflexota bacterium]
MRNILRTLIRFIINLIARVDVSGYEHVPATGNFVIATNHLGIVDAPLAFYALDRWDLFVLIAEKWEKNPFFKWLGKYFNFIFIDRFNPDIRALRKVINLMDEGQNLVIAPEGTRSRVGSLIEGKPGVSYLATRLGQPIVPVALAGTEDRVIFGNLKRLKRSHITVTAGPAFTLPPLPRQNRDEALKQYTDEIMCRIAALLPEKYWGVYAEHPRLKELLANQPAEAA